MNDYRKTVCAVLAVLMLSAGISGCGSTTESAGSDVSSVATTVKEETTTEYEESTTETTQTESSMAEEAITENTFSYTDSAEAAPADETIHAKVTAIDGETLTLSIGGNIDMGEAPEKPDSQSGEDGEAPEKPDQEPGEDVEAPDADHTDQSQQNPGTSDSSEAPDKPDGTAADSDGVAADEAAAQADNGETPDQPDQTADTAEDENAGDANDAAAPAENGEVPEDAGTAADDAAEAGQSDSSPEQQNTEAKEATLIILDESVLTADGEAATLEDIEVGSMLSISFDADGAITEISISSQDTMMGSPGGGMGTSAEDLTFTAVNDYTADTDVTDENIGSTGTDENAVLVENSAAVTIDGTTIDRTSSDSTGGDNSSFYGIGAAVLAKDGTVTISNSDITTDAAGGAGIFSYGDSIVYAANSTISTTQDTSGGIHAAGGGTLYAWNLAVETMGESAAAIRSDRGGGTMVVDGGTYTANGVGSPAVYCTADIAVNDAELTANGSEAICMEGLNSLHLFDCDISGNMQDLDQNDTTWNMIVYQSMSGDAEDGTSTLQIVGGTLTAGNGGILYTTNTTSNILMQDVDITYAADSEFFLQATGNTNQRGWGSSGANGADCTFTADNQEMQGKVIWDSISNLNFYMTNGSSLTGSFLDDETWAGNGGDGSCNVYLSEDSTWTVTGDSTITNLYNAGTIVDEDGNTVSIVGSDGTIYVEGTSQYTITVATYSETADLSGAAAAAAWTDYQVEEPATLQ